MTGGLRVIVSGAGPLARVRAEVENTTPLTGDGLPREEALLYSFIGCHLLFATSVDAFVSLLEPPDWAERSVAACRQHRCWPVLVGPAPARDLMLASPVILYDYAGVAPESLGDFFDGTEIDEMLALRVQTLTEEEKAEARATDPRAAAIIDRCDDLSRETMLSLHGTQREVAEADAPVDPMPEWSQPGPADVLVGGVFVKKGSKVRLRPMRRADAHDLFLADRVATVVDVVHDVDDEVHVAVTVDDDPAAELWPGRYLYFAPDELEPLCRVLVAGVGNIFLSDDGFGPEVVRELASRDIPSGVRVVDYGIRGLHLAFDLTDAVDTLILVDTVPRAGNGAGSLAVIEVSPDQIGSATFDAHDMSPGSVFRSLGALGRAPQTTLVVGCEPASTEDGIGLSEPVAAAVSVAADKIVELVNRELERNP
jgi:hydrogenase maturation protease